MPAVNKVPVILLCAPSGIGLTSLASSFSEKFMKIHMKLLSKLFNKLDEADDLLTHKEVLQTTLRRQVIELALGELLVWCRSEMIQAENIARTLNAKLTVIGIKHHKRALQEIVSHPDAPRIYLSHRISEHRRYNMDTQTENQPLGEWLDVVGEVHTLHREFLAAGQVLINPTAIDELRFRSGDSRGRRDPHLGGRWPLSDLEQELMWSSPHSDRSAEHTAILTADDPSDVDHDDASRSIASSLANRIYFEIAFRDHVIVENTPNLCVYRPFFCVNMAEATSEADWSSGVKRELEHWEYAHRNHDSDIRRLAFVHTTEEIKCRPGTSEGRANVMLCSISEDHNRKAVHLPKLVRELSHFFFGDLDASTIANINSDFWGDCGRCFSSEIEPGISFEEYIADEIGIDYKALQRLAGESGS